MRALCCDGRVRDQVRAGGNAGRAGAVSAVAAPAALIFTGEMYGVQADQLAAVLDGSPRRTAAVVSRWRADGLADSASLGPGQRWVWLTRAGLAACGLPYRASAPGLSRLEHLRAVTAIRLALEATPQFAVAQAHWRGERRIRSRIGGRIGLREHVPDGEIHWPDGADVAWAGECWAIEAELTAKTVARTAAIMRELLTRTGDYGCAAADVRVPGRPPRHARAVYVCSPAARGTVGRARDALGPLGARVEIRLLPDPAAPGSDRRRMPGSGGRRPARSADVP
jgi:hypothetical protein